MLSRTSEMVKRGKDRKKITSDLSVKPQRKVLHLFASKFLRKMPQFLEILTTNTTTLTWKTQIYPWSFFLSHRSGDEKKEKGGEKTPENQNNCEHDTPGKNPKLAHLEINRGTAV